MEPVGAQIVLCFNIYQIPQVGVGGSRGREDAGWNWPQHKVDSFMISFWSQTSRTDVPLAAFWGRSSETSVTCSGHTMDDTAGIRTQNHQASPFLWWPPAPCSVLLTAVPQCLLGALVGQRHPPSTTPDLSTHPLSHQKSLFPDWVEKENAKLMHFINTTPGVPGCEVGVISNFSLPNYRAYSWTSSSFMVWFECSGFSSTCLLHNKFIHVKKKKKDKTQQKDRGDMTSMKMFGGF